MGVRLCAAGMLSQVGGHLTARAVTSGQAAQLAPPPPQTRTCLSQGPTKRGVCASLPAALLPVDATHVTAVPSTPATAVEPPTVSSPTSVWPPGLASAAVSAARRDSAPSHPGRAHFSLPRRTCVCARHAATPQRCCMWDICTPTAAVRLSMRYRSAISSAPRFAMLASKAHFEAGRASISPNWPKASGLMPPISSSRRCTPEVRVFSSAQATPPIMGNRPRGGEQAATDLRSRDLGGPREGRGEARAPIRHT
jgi:hypothetical protein